jgi:hypothetical protein
VDEDQGLRAGYPDYARPYFSFEHNALKITSRGGYGLNQYHFVVEGRINLSVDDTVERFKEQNPYADIGTHMIAEIARLALGQPQYVLQATLHDKDHRILQRGYIKPDGAVADDLTDVERFPSYDLAYERKKAYKAWDGMKGWSLTPVPEDGFYD